MKKKLTFAAVIAASLFALAPRLVHHRTPVISIDAQDRVALSVADDYTMSVVPEAEAAGGMGNTLSGGLLNHFARTTSFTSPTNLYALLYSTCPVAGSSTGTELSGNGYTRSGAIAKADASWTYTAPTNFGAATITNAATISFPAASGSSWTVNCWGLADASSAGNVDIWGPVTGAPVTVSVGATASFAAAAMTVTFQ